MIMSMFAWCLLQSISIVEPVSFARDGIAEDPSIAGLITVSHMASHNNKTRTACNAFHAASSTLQNGKRSDIKFGSQQGYEVAEQAS